MKYLRTETLGNEVLVLYPVDNNTANQEAIENNLLHEAKYLHNKERLIPGLQKMYKAATGVDFPQCVLEATATVDMGAYIDADIADKFAYNEAIRPIVFSHGLTAMGTFYIGLMRDLASQGYLVLALNHQDESCTFTTNSKGEELFYKKAPFYTK